MAEKYIKCLILILALIGSVTVNAAPVEPVGFMRGVSTHLDVASYSPDDIARSFDTMVDVAANTLRVDIRWNTIELSPGVFTIPARFDEIVDMGNARGIKTLLILDYGNRFYDNGGKPVTPAGIAAYVRYVQEVANHFRGRVQMYEVWNEWDTEYERTGGGLGTPQAYMNLLIPTYQALKAIDPDVIVMAGALTTIGDFIGSLLDLGVTRYSDGISIHPYVHCEPGEQGEPPGFLTKIKNIEKRVMEKNGGQTFPLYITEMNWPSSDGGNCGDTTLADQAKFLAQSIMYSHDLRSIRGFWIYDLRNDGVDITEREHNFGIVNYDFSAKPAKGAVRTIYTKMREAEDYVQGLFLELLGRMPDPGGMRTHTNAYLHNHTKLMIRWTVLKSGEYGRREELNLSNTDYVTLLYRQILGRTVLDPSGIAYHAGRLQSGATTRKDLKVTLMASGEFLSKFGTRAENEHYVMGLYRDLLKRYADSQGLKDHADALTITGRTRAFVRNNVLQSGEYKNREELNMTNTNYVRLLYLQILQRDPNLDPGGVAHNLNELTSGVVDRKGLKLRFLNSNEYTGKFVVTN